MGGGRGENEILSFIEGVSHVRGGLYEGFHCTVQCIQVRVKT